MLDLNADSPPSPPDPVVIGLCADPGLGKTRAWRERAALLVKAGFTGVIAVPRLRLGDEIMNDLVKGGTTAYVYRGRDAPDPEQPGKTMCHELPRATLITEALSQVSPRACEYKGLRCAAFDACGYQRQRRQRPQIWIITRQLLFRERPSFIPEPDFLAIDEGFWSAALHGIERPYRLWVREIGEFREVNRHGTTTRDTGATADLMEISRRACIMLEREPEGLFRRAALAAAGITEADLHTAYRLEWRRKTEPEVRPAMPLPLVRDICQAVTPNNQAVARLSRLFKLLAWTAEGSFDFSPWVELRGAVRPGGEKPTPAVSMIWRDGIHPSWTAPTVVMDATMPVQIVREFFPTMAMPRRISVAMPHTRVRQITDRSMAADMLIPSDSANDRTNATRWAHVERVRRYLEVRADEVRPGPVVVVCQLGLEKALIAGALPQNVEIRHFNDITGENVWRNAALLIVIGRTEPSAGTVERIARAIFGTEIVDIKPDEKGNLRYPTIIRGIRLRDGRGAPVSGARHPDPRVEVVRWAICEAGLVQAIGRGRGLNRTPANPLQIDILTNVVLPIEVDEVTTWDLIQPTFAQIMHARGAVPLRYSDIATAYPDLFPSSEAARKALDRENPGQSSIESYLLGVCPGFLSIGYRRQGSRGPAGMLLFDHARVDPRAWLTERIGKVILLDAREPEFEAAREVTIDESKFVDPRGRAAGQLPLPPVASGVIGYDLGRHEKAAVHQIAELYSGQPVTEAGFSELALVDDDLEERRAITVVDGRVTEGTALGLRPTLPSFYTVVEEVTSGRYPTQEDWLAATHRWIERCRLGSHAGEAQQSREQFPVDEIDFSEVEERLAIMTYDGGLTEAEARAELGVIR